MNREATATYSRKITQASRSDLVVITYELINLNLKDAMEIREKDIAEYRISIKKARNLLGELISSLDMQYEISGQLFRIYLYLNKELLHAELTGDDALIPRFCGIIQSLQEAFAEISKEDTSGPVMENTQKVYAGLTYSKGSLNEDLSVDPNRGYKV